jgi:glycosyltransferase involved in cell wall biosynthesis
MSPPTFSVITVCFNARQTLPATRDSLAAQGFSDYEWIVVDGASTDGTVELVQTYGKQVTRFVSEKDAGIYDAMNKGVGLARGKWVYFLNADDRLADATVLGDVSKACSDSNFDLCYGDAIYSNGERDWLKSFAWVTPKKLVYGDLCHQVVFARRSLFGQHGPFDVSLRYNADFDWILRVLRGGAKSSYLKRTIAIFFHGGAHVKNAEASESERFIVRHRYRSPVFWRLGNLVLRVELKVRRMLGESV